MDNKDIFTEYYNKNKWGSPESVSGPGSTIKYTENIRKEIPNIVKEFSIISILDAPCGDYNWFKDIQFFNKIKYTGGDIVSALIEKNNLKYANSGHSFINIDITTDKLPKSDLMICRACLYHFSYGDIFKTLMNFLDSDIEYLLTDNHTDCIGNRDIITGDFRLINLELFPFNLSKPILYIDDWIPGYPVSKIGLWNREMLKKINPGEFLRVK